MNYNYNFYIYIYISINFTYFKSLIWILNLTLLKSNVYLFKIIIICKEIPCLLQSWLCVIKMDLITFKTL